MSGNIQALSMGRLPPPPNKFCSGAAGFILSSLACGVAGFKRVSILLLKVLLPPFLCFNAFACVCVRVCVVASFLWSLLLLSSFVFVKLSISRILNPKP
jgi:hypothetical protein